jgi:hypothetical protein
MTQNIKLNPRLCEMCSEDLDLSQRNLIMAFLPFLGAPLAGSRVSQETFKLVNRALEALSGPLGEWKLVWGPGVFQDLPGGVPANTMFVARHQHTGELVISIAGTNPFSAYAWIAEDFDMGESRTWVYGEPPQGAATSKATLTGLRALQGMVPPAGVPGENTTLAAFLRAELDEASGPVNVTVTGHSLGGALSPTLALWLLDTQPEWDKHLRAAVSVFAYAGPTPGNDEFASYVEQRFGERMHRIFNSFDIVPHAWKVSDLALLKALYTPQIGRDALWDRAVDYLIVRSNGINYRHIDPGAKPLDGRVNQDLVWHWMPSIVNVIGQILYQHTLAYFDLLGIAYPEKRSTLGRHLARESDAVANEILKRVGVWEPLARLLGANLRLLSEAYSRLPLVPSLIPESRALE